MSVQAPSPRCFMYSRSLLLTAVVVSLANLVAAGPREVTAVRCSSLPGATRIAIEITGETRYRSGRAENPARVFFDFISTRPYVSGRRLYSTDVGDKLVKRIRVAESASEVTRVVLDLESAVEFKVSRFANPSRFVIDLSPAGIAPVSSMNLARLSAQSPSEKTSATAPGPLPPSPSAASAAGGVGVVKAANQPVPGATVTATQGATTVVTTTDQDGHYALPQLEKGVWILEVTMTGFEPAKKELTVSNAAQDLDFGLELKESPMTAHLSRSPGVGAGQRSAKVELQPQTDLENSQAQQVSPPA